VKITELAKYKFEPRFIDLWKNDGHGELLPIQEQAIKKGKVLDGQHVVVSSPTSSGKTFIGELAAVRAASLGKRAIYLVPQKALAEEKFHEFQRKYKDFGLRTVISTRDRKQYDRDICRGRFHIAVVVFEKMQALMVACPGMLQNVGLVIIDELQVMGDATRGPGLEILLSKIKLAAGSPQIIGLSAVLGNDQSLADWLGAKLCKIEARPIELRKGVLWNGSFRFTEYNSGNHGVETFPIRLGRFSREQVTVDQTKSWAEAGEPTLIFCRAKKECIDMAHAIAKGINTPAASGALSDLASLEDSEGKDLLAVLLAKGVAYHNSDLDWDQRDLIERWFKAGEIKVICATSTLAMGINFPAKNVIIEPSRWSRDASDQWITVDISQAEYENMCGRAGRLGMQEDFGRAVIVAPSDFDQSALFTRFVEGDLGDLKPTLDNVPLAQHALNLVASKLCKTEEEIHQILLTSYTGEQLWKGGDREKKFTADLAKNVQHCIDGELLEFKRGNLTATELGKLTAAKGIRVETAIAMSKFAHAHQKEAASIEPLEVLWCLTSTECGADIHFNLSTTEWKMGEYSPILEAVIKGLNKKARARLATVNMALPSDYDETKQIKKALLLNDWISGFATRDLENRYHCFTGSVSGLASEYAWLTDAFSSVARIAKWPDEESKRIEDLAIRLIHGVPVNAISLTPAKVRGLGRGRIMNLVANGIDTIEKLLKYPIEKLEKLLTKPVSTLAVLQAGRLIRNEELQADAIPAEEASQAPEEAQETEWSAQVPPSDDLGQEYQTNLQVDVHGQCRQSRYLVRISGKDAWLTETSFSTMLHLCVAAKTDDLGWILGSSIDPDNFHQTIRRLKKDLAVDGVDTAGLIENSRSKSYRISTPPANIAINNGTVLRHYAEAEKILKPLNPHD